MSHGETPVQEASAQAGMNPSAIPALTEILRFPAEDEGKSLIEAASSDLESALQLLAERAQYVMGASGVAIALRDGEEMICRASAGPSAPPLETQLQVNSGLTAESIRKQEVLRCDDAESDRRVDRDCCRALGVKSVMVTPLVRQKQSIGVFELLAERSHAFEERDVTVLQRLSDMVITALEHADVAAREPEDTATSLQEIPQLPVVEPSLDLDVSELVRPFEDELLKLGPAPDLTQEVGHIHKCSACGFPISAGRALCLDCEKAQASAVVPASDVPEFPAEYTSTAERSWFARGFYLIAMLLTMLATVWLVFRH